MKRRALRALVITLALGGCHEQTAPPKLEAHSGKADEATSDGGFVGLDPLAMRVVLEDPRLTSPRDRAMIRDWSGAARGLDEVRRPLVLTRDEDCAWTYASARLHLAAGEFSEAVEGFDRVAGVALPKIECPLAGYASLRAAQAYERLGRPHEAEARALATPGDLALHDDSDVVLADALSAKGDVAGAVRLWRATVANPRGPWVDVAVRLATALLDGADGDPFSHAAEARDLATRVVVEAPKIAETSGAQRARSRAVAVLRTRDLSATDELTDTDLARQARAWLEGGEPSKAFATATALMLRLQKPPRSPSVACGAAITRAQASARLAHVVSADAWGEAITQCEGDESLPTALYSGGKSSLGAKRLEEAAARFARVEKLFPTHRLADDARVQGALVALQRGDEARFTSMLLTLPDDYPDGDMRTEALFRVALLRMTKGDWEGAKPSLDRIQALSPDDRHWATEGRAAYFRARASLATGDAADARARYARVVSECPLAFYMTQAYGRLAFEDAAFARHTFDEAVEREMPGPLLTRDHPELRTPAASRALRLLEVGDLEAARREIAAAGLIGDTTDSEVIWAVGQLYDRAGAPELGHGFARARVRDHLAHYPAGRWRAMWEIAFPRAFEPFVVRESSTRGIPRALAWAIMREESDFFPEAKSAASAYGLMQLIVPTARGVAAGTGLGWDEEALKRPDVSIALGSKLLAGLRSSFPDNRALAIAAYNGGAGAVNRWVDAHGSDDFDLWVEEIPWDETRGYIKRVLASEAAYAFLYDRASLDEVLAVPVRVTGRWADAGASD